MLELIQLENSKSLSTFLCRNCGYCIINDGDRECEWDKFKPTTLKKSDLYTPVEFDCIHYIER